MSGTLPDDSMWDKTYGAGPVIYSLKIWLMFLIVVIGAYAYFTRYYAVKPALGSYYY